MCNRNGSVNCVAKAVASVDAIILKSVRSDGGKLLIAKARVTSLCAFNRTGTLRLYQTSLNNTSGR